MHFFLRINSPSAGRNSGSAVSASVTNPLPDISNYSPFCHTYYLIPDQLLVFPGQTLYQAALLETTYCCSTLLQNLVGNSCRVLHCLEEAEQQAEASGDVRPPFLQTVISTPLLVEWLSNLFVTERTKVSNFDTSSISMYSVRKISAPKKMADVPRITAVLKINARKIREN